MLLRGRENQFFEWPLGPIGREVARDPFRMAIELSKSGTMPKSGLLPAILPLDFSQ
jgi:hypothetical protein